MLQKKKWTFPVKDTKSDISIIFNDKNYTNFNVTTNSSGDTEITFGTEMTYSADPGDTNTSSMLGVFIKPGSKATSTKQIQSTIIVS